MRFLFLLTCCILAGCSLFGPDTRTLTFRVVADAQVVLAEGQTSVTALARSQAEAEALRAAYGLDGVVPDVEWSRESLFVLARRLRPGERIAIERVSLRGDERFSVAAVVSGQPTSTDSTVTRLVAIVTESVPGAAQVSVQIEGTPLGGR